MPDLTSLAVMACYILIINPVIGWLFKRREVDSYLSASKYGLIFHGYAILAVLVIAEVRDTPLEIALLIGLGGR
ncbi:hypothetical protein ACWJJH_03095 [Endozoicomonadaceae bacterium StTr2]